MGQYLLLISLNPSSANEHKIGQLLEILGVLPIKSVKDGGSKTYLPFEHKTSSSSINSKYKTGKN
tara:strand:- start:279 stop:473 length:195 start_codon:yes stop_codon:yes gene_type:complete